MINDTRSTSALKPISFSRSINFPQNRSIEKSLKTKIKRKTRTSSCVKGVKIDIGLVAKNEWRTTTNKKTNIQQ